MNNQNDFPIVLKQIFQAMWYTFQKSCEEIISMGFMTLFQWQCFYFYFFYTNHAETSLSQN